MAEEWIYFVISAILLLKLRIIIITNRLFI